MAMITKKLLEEAIREAEKRFPSRHSITYGALKLSGVNVPSGLADALWKAYELGISKAKLACKLSLVTLSGKRRTFDLLGLTQFFDAVEGLEGADQGNWFSLDCGIAFSSASLHMDNMESNRELYWTLGKIFWEMERKLMQSYIFIVLLRKLQDQEAKVAN